jgi:hypothetical protein
MNRCGHHRTGWAKSSCANNMLHCAVSGKVPYVEYFRWHKYLCHLTLGVNSNTYCNRKYCTFTVTSSLIYILLPTGARGLLVHPVPCYVTRLYSSVAESITHSSCVSGQKWIIIAPWKQIQHTFYVTFVVLCSAQPDDWFIYLQESSYRRYLPAISSKRSASHLKSYF